MPTNIEVTGIDKVRERLDRIQGRMLVGEGVDVLREWGLASEAMARILAPVDTGRLRASIRYVRLSPFEAVVGCSCEYGRFVEYGTSRTIRWKDIEGFSGSSPFLRPACWMALNTLIIRIKEFLRNS